jgi:hypothetical protein
MSMVAKQQRFALAIADLIHYANDNGLPVTFGDAYRDPRLHGKIGEKLGYGNRHSCHKLRLAVDLNIIIDGEIAGSNAYNFLHDYWDKLGGAQRIPEDLNHFSFLHQGYR